MCRFTTAMPFKVIIHHFLLLPRCNIALCFWPCPSMSRLPGWLAVPDSNRQFPQLEHRVQYCGAHIAHNYTMLSHSQSSSSGTQNTGEWAPRIKSNQPNLRSWGIFFMATYWDGRMFLGGWRRMTFSCEMEPWLFGNEVCVCLCANVCVCVWLCSALCNDCPRHCSSWFFSSKKKEKS